MTRSVDSSRIYEGSGCDRQTPQLSNPPFPIHFLFHLDFPMLSQVTFPESFPTFRLTLISFDF